MGSFVFKWDHPASEVYVTGTFDDWSKSEKLIKNGDSFEKDVTLPSAAEKIYYKFVVDGNWVTDHTAPQENDDRGNLNNVLTTDRIIKHTPATAGIMSSVTPASTTADLAKDVPLEKSGSSDLPGAFPETPNATDKAEFSVNPLPAADGAVNPIQLAPGEPVPDPSTFTNHTVTSGVHDDPELVAAAEKKEAEAEPTFSVAPLPAFPGAVNPVTVAPGETLPDPSTVTSNTINSAVTLDKESYEKSGEGTFDASPTIQSSGPQSTTAQLAASVPLEPKVPEVVKESQEEAGIAPEASAIPAEVEEKNEVEAELLKEVPEVPATSEGTGGQGTDKSEFTPGEAAAAAVGGAAVVGGAVAAAESEEPAKDTPEIVKESIEESGQPPEAAANEEAVLEKKAVEKELLSEIKPETSTGEPAPKITSTETPGGLEAPAAPVPVDSRDVSPGTVPGAHTETKDAPVVPAATTPAKEKTDAPATPAKATPSSSKAAESPAGSSTTDKKKKNRTSFFGKLKAKLSSKD